VSNEPRRAIIFGSIKAICLLGLLLFCCPIPSRANQDAAKILCRPELASGRRVELAEKLRRITGWQELSFDESGALHLGDEKAVGGSPTARELLKAAMIGKNVIVLEDASNRQDIVFCRVIEGRWKTDAANKPPVFVIQIDFADFSHVMGDKAALDAFNAGWGVLHEFEHVVHDSIDSVKLGEAGECESFINRMRRECGLAERADYYFTLFPGTSDSEFKTEFVRLAFDLSHPGANKKERHWLIWDARLVGGLEEQKSLVARM
jgi:hypothetical protein